MSTYGAKQFLAFDALKGLQEALREKEIEQEKKVEASQGRIIIPCEKNDDLKFIDL